MIELLDNEGLERSTESFSSDPEMALKNLKVIIVRFVLGRQHCTCMSICNTRTRELLRTFKHDVFNNISVSNKIIQLL